MDYTLGCGRSGGKFIDGQKNQVSKREKRHYCIFLKMNKVVCCFYEDSIITAKRKLSLSPFPSSVMRTGVGDADGSTEA